MSVYVRKPGVKGGRGVIMYPPELKPKKSRVFAVPLMGRGS